MRTKLTSDTLLYEKLRSARRGLKLCRKLKKNMKKNSQDILIIQPDGYGEESVYSLTCLAGLCRTQEIDRIHIVTTNPDMELYAPLFTDRLGSIMVISPDQSKELMDYALMTNFEPDWFIASFTQPFGRWGDKVIEYNHIGPEHLFATGIYRVWHYIPESVPKYTGSNPKITDFLNRVKKLQEKSISIDAECSHVK